MAGQDGQAAHHLEVLQRLRQEPKRFSLFAALSLVERADPARPRIGEARRPADESVRITQPPHLTFAPSDVDSAEHATRGRLQIGQFGFGIFGPNGAVPYHLTEYAFERWRHHDDGAIVDFVNAFQHRFATLFYRAWAHSEPVASHARPDRDEFSGCLAALIGLFGDSALNRDSIDDAAKLFRAGLLAPGSRSAEGLESLLSDYLGQKVEVRQFVAGWLRVPRDLQTRLGRSGGYAALGVDATLGASSWQCGTRFEVAIGPLAFGDFLNFLPGSRALRAIADLVRLYTSGEWSWQVRLLVSEGDAPGASLGKVGRLGWTSWLGRKHGVAEDVVFLGEQVAAA